MYSVTGRVTALTVSSSQMSVLTPNHLVDDQESALAKISHTQKKVTYFSNAVLTMIILNGHGKLT